MGNNSNVETAGANAPVVITPSQVNLALWLLMFIHVLNALDRQILNILAEPISRELGLSDTQIGLMTGLAFALFYTTLGIPLARFADNPRSNRVGLMAVCLAVWSGMTAASAFAQSFIHMLVARIGVGAGEAGCTPAATSLFADIVPSHKRASAMAFYMMGMPIGSLMGLVVGGLVSDAYGWRAAFLVVGLPGLVMAVILWLVVKEPRRFLTSLQKPVGLDAAPPGRVRAGAWPASPSFPKRRWRSSSCAPPAPVGRTSTRSRPRCSCASTSPAPACPRRSWRGW